MSMTRWLQRYPVTVTVATPYIALVLPLAVLNDNPKTGFIFGLLVLASIGAFLVESLFVGLRTPAERPDEVMLANSRHKSMSLVARCTTVASIVCDLVFAANGGGSVLTQVTSQIVSSPLASIAVLGAGWKYLAVGLLISSYHGGKVTRSSFYSWIAALIATQVVVGLLTGRTAPFICYATFVAFVGVVFGIVRAKHIGIAAAVLLIAWPTIFTLRNEIRKADGITVSETVSAQDRLRFDVQVARPSYFEVPVDVGQPGIAEMLRYGAIPRVLDPNRPTISTGAKINAYLDGNAKSAYTFLPIGTIYFLDGPAALPVFYGAWAFATVLLLRTRGGPGPIRLCVFCLAAAGPLNWCSTYPDSMIGMVQTIVSALPICGAVALLQRIDGKKAVRAQELTSPTSGRLVGAAPRSEP
jgi:hypothetical protein